MALSNLDDARAQYFDNLDYDVESSVAKCKLFIAACRALILHIPARIAHGGMGADAHEFNQEELRLQEKTARDWLGINDPTLADAGGGGGIMYTDFSDIRR